MKFRKQKIQGRNFELVSFNKMKRILDRDDSVKFSSGLFYNDKKAYGIKGARGTNVARDYYYNMENKIVKVSDKNFIKDLLYKKHADHDLVDGKFCYNGIIYDGGEFAKQECIKYEDKKMKRIWEDYKKTVFEAHNSLTDKKVEEILRNEIVEMTLEARERAHLIAKRMLVVSKGNNEIYMEGLNFLDKKDDPVIRDVYIADGQIATPSNCGYISESINLTTEKLSKENKYRASWIHSHANMSTFHSPKDDKNLETLTFMYGRKINLEVLAWGYKSKTEVKIFPSLVFNVRKDRPYVEIGARYFSPTRVGDEGRLRYLSNKNAILGVRFEDNGINLSIPRIDREIRERVTWPGKRVSRNLEETLEQQPVSFMNLPKKTPESVKKEEKEYSPSFFNKLKVENQSKKSPIERILSTEKIQNKIVEVYNDLIADYNLFKEYVFNNFLKPKGVSAVIKK